MVTGHGVTGPALHFWWTGPSSCCLWSWTAIQNNGVWVFSIICMCIFEYFSIYFACLFFNCFSPLILLQNPRIYYGLSFLLLQEKSFLFRRLNAYKLGLNITNIKKWLNCAVLFNVILPPAWDNTRLCADLVVQGPSTCVCLSLSCGDLV